MHVCALVAIFENLHFSMEEAVQETDSAVAVDGKALEGEENTTEIQPPPVVPPADATKLSDAVNVRLLSTVLGYLKKGRGRGQPAHPRRAQDRQRCIASPSECERSSDRQVVDSVESGAVQSTSGDARPQS